MKAKLAGSSFGDAGRVVVIEEGLTGAELSVLAVCDGTRAVPLAPAQDFKRIRDGDEGPNTGGMGAYSPVPAAGDDLVGAVMDDFVEPTLDILRKHDIDFRGTLYAGLMMTPDGPKLLEFNVRFGDPEAQVVLPRLRSDLCELLASAADGHVVDTAPRFVDGAAVCVVGASPGYPEAPRTGAVIEGIEAFDDVDDVDVFCAGVARDEARKPGHRRGSCARRRRVRTDDRGGAGLRLRRRAPGLVSRHALSERHCCFGSEGGALDVKVAVLMGSPNDKDTMQPAADTLEKFGIEADVRVHVGPPQPRPGGRVRVVRSCERLLPRSSAARAWRPISPARRPRTRRFRWSVSRCRAARSTASTRSTRRCRCRQECRWPRSRSTER